MQVRPPGSLVRMPVAASRTYEMPSSSSLNTSGQWSVHRPSPVHRSWSIQTCITPTPPLSTTGPRRSTPASVRSHEQLVTKHDADDEHPHHHDTSRPCHDTPQPPPVGERFQCRPGGGDHERVDRREQAQSADRRQPPAEVVDDVAGGEDRQRKRSKPRQRSRYPPPVPPPHGEPTEHDGREHHRPGGAEDAHRQHAGGNSGDRNPAPRPVAVTEGGDTCLYPTEQREADEDRGRAGPRELRVGRDPPHPQACHDPDRQAGGGTQRRPHASRSPRYLGRSSHHRCHALLSRCAGRSVLFEETPGWRQAGAAVGLWIDDQKAIDASTGTDASEPTSATLSPVPRLSR